MAITRLPEARKSRSAAPISCNLDRPDASSWSRSRTMSLIRESVFARAMDSVTSLSRVSGSGPPEASPSARRTESPDSWSTNSPCGAMTRAALRGTIGMEVCRAARTNPKIMSISARCSTLRIPSRIRQTSPKNPLRADPALIQCSDLLVDAGCFARQLTQVVQLRTAYIAAALHADFADRGAEGLEHALDTFAVGNLAHGEGRVEAAVLLRDDHTLVGLNALAITFHHFDLHDDGIAGIEVRKLACRPLAVEFLDDLIHNYCLARSFLNSSNNSRSSSLMPRRSSSSGRRNHVRPSACCNRQR